MSLSLRDRLSDGWGNFIVPLRDGLAFWLARLSLRLYGAEDAMDWADEMRDLAQRNRPPCEPLPAAKETA